MRHLNQRNLLKKIKDNPPGIQIVSCRTEAEVVSSTTSCRGSRTSYLTYSQARAGPKSKSLTNCWTNHRSAATGRFPADFRWVKNASKVRKEISFSSNRPLRLFKLTKIAGRESTAFKMSSLQTAFQKDMTSPKSKQSILASFQLTSVRVSSSRHQP